MLEYWDCDFQGSKNYRLKQLLLVDFECGNINYFTIYSMITIICVATELSIKCKKINYSYTKRIRSEVRT